MCTYYWCVTWFPADKSFSVINYTLLPAASDAWSLKSDRGNMRRLDFLYGLCIALPSSAKAHYSASKE